MRKETAFHIFEENDIKPRLKTALEEAEACFQRDKDSFKEQFLVDMEAVCGRQEQLRPGEKTAYMDWELLRTNLSAEKDEYRIMLYGTEWFIGEGTEAGATDVSLIMGLYHNMVDRLKEDALRYVGKIPPLAVETQTALLLPPFHEYVKELIQYAVTDATELEAFRQLDKEAEFQIRVGGCLDPGFLVYMEDRDKDHTEIINRLQLNGRGSYCFQDFRNIDFSGLELAANDFRNADFRDAVMEETNLGLSLLTGARFRRSRLKGAKLSGSMLHGADFIQADLHGAHMEGTLMYDGKDASTAWRTTGYPAGTFAGADLRGADFRECIYCGTDFSGACLTGADFTGASLFRCRFTRGQLEQTSFTGEQRSQITLIKG